MTKNSDSIKLWLARSLRGAAEAEKFRLLAGLAVQLGRPQEEVKNLLIKSRKFGIGSVKSMKKAIDNGFDPNPHREAHEEKN